MNFGELKAELRARLSIATGNSFWTDEMLGEWINQANRWACTYKYWPFTEKAKYTVSRANARYYDYPPTFRTDSIRRLEIDGTEYEKKRYEDFMKYIKENPNGTDKIFSDFERFYFIHPVVKEDGKEIVVWGQEKPKKLENDEDTTPFSEGEEDGEEAIIKRALMIALQKAKKYTEAQIQKEEAKEILEQIWSRIKEEQALYQTKDRPFFDVPQFF